MRCIQAHFPNRLWVPSGPMTMLPVCWSMERTARLSAANAKITMPSPATAAHRVRTTLRPGGWDAVLAVDISLAMADGRLDDAEVLIPAASAPVGPDSQLTILFDYQSGVLDHLRGSHDDASGAPTSHLARFVSPPWEVARRSARDGDWQTATSSLTALMPHSVDELRKPLPIMNVLVAVAQAAGLVRDADRAAMLIPALQP